MLTKRKSSRQTKRRSDHATTRPLDLSYFHAAPLMLRHFDELTLCLVGCGGTGIWLAPHVARIAHVMRESGKTIHVLFVDHDVVEEQNIARQHFCYAEAGKPKAATLAARYSAALGLEIHASVERFSAQIVSPRLGWNKLVILIGCVDNATARQTLAHALTVNEQAGMGGAAPSTWWLDCGNARENGQVLLGSALSANALRDAFPLPTVCAALPAPSLQQPKLLEALPEELTSQLLSCAELAARNAQSLAVNQTVAAIATDYLVRMLLSHDLRRFATTFDLASGSARSTYITPQAIAAVVHKSPQRLFRQTHHPH